MRAFRNAFYRFLSAIPARVVGSAGQFASISAALWPDKIKHWLGQNVTPEHIRIVAIPCIAIFAVYWLVLWLMKPGKEEGLTPPGFTFSGSNHGDVHMGHVFHLNDPSTPKPTTSLVLHARLIRYEYLDGIHRCGIIWRSGFAHVEVLIANPSEVSFENVSVLIRTDFLIAKATAMSLTNVKIAPAYRSNMPMVIGKLGDDKMRVVGSYIPSDEDQCLDSTYKLFCENFPAKSDLQIDLAVAQAASIDQPGDIFLPVPPTPTIVAIQANYTAYGEQRSEEQEITL